MSIACSGTAIEKSAKVEGRVPTRYGQEDECVMADKDVRSDWEVDLENDDDDRHCTTMRLARKGYNVQMI